MPDVPHLPAAVTALLESMDGAVLLTDADGTIILFNADAEALFGYRAADVVGKPVEVLLPAAQRKRHAHLREHYKQVPRARPLVSGLELTGRRRDGTRFRAEIELAPVQTDDGLYIASNIREVTKDLPQGEFFRTLLETAPDAMIIADAAGRISIVNTQTERMFGYSREELLGRQVEMLLPEGVRDRHVKHRASYGIDPSVRMMGAGLTLTGRRKDGGEFPVEISLSPVAISGSRYVSTMIRDITERKQLENELENARSEAERLSEANRAFVAAASHDLRQPVQALGLLNGALRRVVSDAHALSLIESQQQSVRAMTNLLNSLLDISRLDAGAVSPEVDTFAIQRLFDRLASEFGRQARQKGLAFTALPCDAVVRSDPNLLGEIIQNFVSNAIRYTKAGSVVLSATAEGDTCRIQVTDSGIGIATEELERIFDEFHQSGGKRSGNEGFGLGLAIVRRLAELLGHRIDVTSAPGAGSSFSVTVPLAEYATYGQDAGTRYSVESVAPGAGLIITIEDDTAVSEALRVVLEAEGYRVSQNGSSDELRARLAGLDEVPVLIISDFHLGEGLTGADLIGEIREHFATFVPAFIISGDTSRILVNAQDIPECVLMSKPVDPDRLVEAVRRAVHRSSPQV